MIDISLAGHAAERLLGTVIEGSESDFLTATQDAMRIVRGGFCEEDELALFPESVDGSLDLERNRPKANAILAERMKIVSLLLAKHKAVLKSIAEELVRSGTLFQEGVAAALRRKASRRTMRKESNRE